MSAHDIPRGEQNDSRSRLRIVGFDITECITRIGGNGVLVLRQHQFRPDE